MIPLQSIPRNACFMDAQEQAELRNLYDDLPVSAIKRHPTEPKLEIKNGQHTLWVYVINTNLTAPEPQRTPRYAYVIETEGGQVGIIDEELFNHMLGRADIYATVKGDPKRLAAQSILSALSSN